MIALMKRILSVSGPYQGRIKLAFVFAFLKAMLSKAPIGLSFLALSAFLQGTMTARLCLWLAVGTVGCVLLECLCQNIADRLQAAAGYMVFADLRMELGRHLRRLPMGYFTEGNIGKISSVLSTDMVFIEENCMHDIANMMSYTFAQAILVLWLAFLNPWLGLAALVVVLIIWQLGRASLGSTLAHSDIRQEQSEALTRAVLDYVEGIGIAKTFNRAGRAFRAAHREFRPEPQGQHRVRGESGSLDAGPLSGVRSGLGADNPPVTLALWPWAALHHLSAGCLALRL